MSAESAHRIVIADDDLGLRTLLSTLFGLEPDFEVLAVAADGGAALDAVSAAHEAGRPPHAVLLDLTLPGIDGVSVARELASQYPDVLVIVHTGRPIDDARAALRGTPISGCIEKGTRVDMLASRVRELCNQPESANAVAHHANG